MPARLAHESGMALVAALMAMLLFVALGTALMRLAGAEGRIASNYRVGSEALYAAEAAAEVAFDELVAVPDLTVLLSGQVTSSRVDGPPGGIRHTAAGQIDLTSATNMVRCGKATTCSAGEIAAVTDDRPWGTNNPVWQLYAYGPLRELLRQPGIQSDVYVVVWVGDRRGIVALLAHAYGIDGSSRAVEVTVARIDPAGPLRVLSWLDVS